MKAGDTVVAYREVLGVDFIPDESPSGFDCGNGGRSAPHKRVQNSLTLKGVKPDQTLDKRNRKGGWVAYSTGRFRWNTPDTCGCGHEFVTADGGLPFVQPVETLLGKDQDVLVQVSQCRVTGRHPRSPRTRSGYAFPFDPDDFSTHEET